MKGCPLGGSGTGGLGTQRPDHPGSLPLSSSYLLNHSFSQLRRSYCASARCSAQPSHPYWEVSEGVGQWSLLCCTSEAGHTGAVAPIFLTKKRNRYQGEYTYQGTQISLSLVLPHEEIQPHICAHTSLALPIYPHLERQKKPTPNPWGEQERMTLCGDRGLLELSR